MSTTTSTATPTPHSGSGDDDTTPPPTTTTANSCPPTTSTTVLVNHDEVSMYNDLLSFLQSTRFDLRYEAIKAIQQVIVSSSSSNDDQDDQVEKLMQHDSILKTLIMLTSDDSLLVTKKKKSQDENDGSNNNTNNDDIVIKSISTSALQCLLQLCSISSAASSERYIYEMIQLGIVKRLLEIIITTNISATASSTNNNHSNNIQRMRVYLALALLANVTRYEQGSIQLVGLSVPEHAIYNTTTTTTTTTTTSNVPETIVKDEEEREISEEKEEGDKKEEGEEETKKNDPSPTLVILLQRFLNPSYIVLEEEEEADGDGDDDDAELRRKVGLDVDDDDIDDDIEDPLSYYDEEETDGGDGKNDKTTMDVIDLTNINDTNICDPYQHFATILMNITQTELGRKFVLQIPKQNKGDAAKKNKDGEDAPLSVLQKLLPQLKLKLPSTTSSNKRKSKKSYSNSNSNNANLIIRQRGVAGMIRNCCLDTDSSWWLLHVCNILDYVLYPLAGNESLSIDEKKGMNVDLWIDGYEKQRSQDMYTRLYCIESILLLCATGRNNRKTIRLARTYVVLKYCDMVEPNENCSERINEIVQFLKRDEDGTQEGSSDQFIDDYYQINTTTTSNNANEEDGAINKPTRLLLPPSTSNMITSNNKGKKSSDDDDENYDTVD